MGNSKAIFWYPFRSAEVQAICEHLTAQEHVRLRACASRWGAVMGAGGFLAAYVPLHLLGYVVRPAFAGIWYLPLLLAVGIPLGFLFGWIVGAPMRARMRRILCETEYARQAGFTPGTLRLYNSQFSLRTLLAWGVPWAALVAWIAAWDGPFDPLDANDAGFNQIIKLNLIIVMTMLYGSIFALTRSRAKSKPKESAVDG